MSTFRGFIAIEINATPNILEFEKEIKKTGADVKLVEPQNIHITLKFLGDVKENLIDEIEQIMKDAVKKIQPFTIKLKGTGVFPNQNYVRVVWIEIKEAQVIETIANAIDERLSKLGFKKEKRGFSPHLTIGRVKTAKNKQQLLKVIEKYIDVEFSIQEINSIRLKKSDLTSAGPIYTTIRDVTF
jgi:2'-5' RNA ligase